MRPAASDALGLALARLAPDRVAVAAVPLGDAVPRLWPGEEAAVRDASVARLAEFAAGRHASRLALGRLGWPACALPSLPHRAPAWPPGVVGSITHAGGVAAAAVGLAADWAGIGVDLEPAGAVEAALAPEVLRPDEADALGALPGAFPGGLTAAFCAKEAAFKAISARIGGLLEFRDIALRGITATGFEALLCRSAGTLAAGLRLRGRWVVEGGYQLALVAWPIAAENNSPSLAASRVTS